MLLTEELIVRYLSSDESLLAWLRPQLSEADQVMIAGAASEDGVLLLGHDLQALLARGGRLTVRGGADVRALERLRGEYPMTVVVDPTPPEAGLRIVLHLRHGKAGFVGSGALTAASLDGGASGMVLDARRDQDQVERLALDLAPPDTAYSVQEFVFEDAMQSFVEGLEQRAGLVDWRTGERQQRQTPHLTQHHDLDSLTGGGQPGHLWVLNGPSGVGKTVFALGLARAVAIGTKRPVRWLSTRDDVLHLVSLVMSAEARVPLHHMSAGSMSDDDWARMARRMGEVAEAPLRVVEIDQERLIDHVADLGSSHDEVDLLVVDSLADPTDMVALRRLKQYALDTSTWVVAVGADGPGLGQRETQRAQVVAADLIAWLDRPDMEDPQSPRAGEADIRVTRSRFSPTAVITVAFQGHYARFTDMTGA